MASSTRGLGGYGFSFVLSFTTRGAGRRLLAGHVPVEVANRGAAIGRDITRASIAEVSGAARVAGLHAHADRGRLERSLRHGARARGARQQGGIPMSRCMAMPS